MVADQEREKLAADGEQARVAANPERNIVAAEPNGQAWQSTSAASFWVHMERFLRPVEAMNEFIIPELSSLSVFPNHPEIQELAGFLDVSSIPGIKVLPMHWMISTLYIIHFRQ